MLIAYIKEELINTRFTPPLDVIVTMFVVALIFEANGILVFKGKDASCDIHYIF